MKTKFCVRKIYVYFRFSLDPPAGSGIHFYGNSTVVVNPICFTMSYRIREQSSQNLWPNLSFEPQFSKNGKTIDNVQFTSSIPAEYGSVFPI